MVEFLASGESGAAVDIGTEEVPVAVTPVRHKKVRLVKGKVFRPDFGLEIPVRYGEPMPKEVPPWLQSARDAWTNRGDRRPAFAIEPAPDQESVWDYPRPPAIVEDRRLIEIEDDQGPIASTTTSIRVLETSHPPSFYLPPEAIVPGRLVLTTGSSHCEWKGRAEYLALADGAGTVGWRYPAPYPEFASYANWTSFYPDRVRCRVDGKPVRAQAGGFYGGWITDDVVGPFKGDPGTSGW